MSHLTATRDPIAPRAEVPLALEIRDVRRTFTVSGVPVVALDGASIRVRAGEFVVLRGRSGSGKSSLLAIAGLLARADSGSVSVAGEDVDGIGEARAADLRARSIGFVFQSFNLLPHLSAVENVALAWPGSTASAHLEAVAGLERVGLGDRVDHTPGQLSGGEQQRVAVARALINDPALVLADEPSGNLDADSERLVLEQLSAAARRGCGVLVVSHSASVAAAADRVVSIAAGGVA